MYSINELRDIINSAIKKESEIINSLSPNNLYEAVTYTLGMGGKRLRPVMLLLSFQLFSRNINSAIHAALAIEIFHNFTLLHDDIMDNAVLRRNQQTVHTKYNKNIAILSGDVMSFLAFKYLYQSNSNNQKEINQIFTKTAIQVCEGQQFDMDFENELGVSEKEYLKMIHLKTAVLMGCSLKIGALLANAPVDISDKLYNLGINLGMAFQLQDDLFDSMGNELTFGKKIGGDIVSNKKTFLLIKTLALADIKQKNELLKWITTEKFNAEVKIESVLTIYKQLNIEKITQEKIKNYYQNAYSIFNELPLTNIQKVQLEQLLQTLFKRLY